MRRRDSISLSLLLLGLAAGPAAAQTAGSGVVTLYADKDFTGGSERFQAADPDLSDNPIGNDSASSVRVASGCQVRLFEDADYGGRELKLNASVESLRGLPVGNDAVSSLKIVCDLETRPGVTLYEHGDFEGRSEKFYEDSPRLKDHLIGARSASSLKIDAGCELRVYPRPDYEGRWQLFAEDVPDLGDSAIGNDAIASLRIQCPAVVARTAPPPPQPPRVASPPPPSPPAAKPAAPPTASDAAPPTLPSSDGRGFRPARPPVLPDAGPAEEDVESRLWTPEQRARLPLHVRDAHAPDTPPAAELLGSAEELFGPNHPYTILLLERRVRATGLEQDALESLIDALEAVTEANREPFDPDEAQPGARDPNEAYQNFRNAIGIDLIVELGQAGRLEPAVRLALALVGEDPTRASLGRDNFELMHIVLSRHGAEATPAARRLDEHLNTIEHEWRLFRSSIDTSRPLDAFAAKVPPVRPFSRRAFELTASGETQSASAFALAGLLLEQELRSTDPAVHALLSQETAYVLDHLGQTALAEELSRAAVARAKSIVGDQVETTFFRLHHATLLLRQGRYDEAETLYLAAAARLRAATSETWTESRLRRHLTAISKNLGVLYDATGRRHEAETRFTEAAPPPPPPPRRPAPKSAEEARQQTIEHGFELQRLSRPGVQRQRQREAPPRPPPLTTLQSRAAGSSFELSHAALATYYSQRGKVDLAYRHAVDAIVRDQYDYRHRHPLLKVYSTLKKRQVPAEMERYRERLDEATERLLTGVPEVAALRFPLIQVYTEMRAYDKAVEINPEGAPLDALLGAGRIEQAYERSLYANGKLLELRRREPKATIDTTKYQPQLYTLLADYPQRLSPREAFAQHLGFKQAAEIRTRAARHRLLQLSDNRDLELMLKEYAYRRGSWTKLYLNNLEASGDGFKPTELTLLETVNSRHDPGTVAKLFDCAFYEVRPCSLHYQDAGAIHLDDFIHDRVVDIYGWSFKHSAEQRLEREPDLAGRKEADPDYWQRLIEYYELTPKEEVQRSEALAAEFEVIHERYERWKSLPLDVDSLASSLPDGSLYLDFGRFRRYDYPRHAPSSEWRYYAFAYRVGGAGHRLSFADLGPAGDVDRIVGQMRETINRARGEDIPAIHSQAEALYAKILAPFAELLDAADVVIVSAEGRLHLLPFDVLRPPGGGYLVDTHTVVYSHAADWLDVSFWDTLPGGARPGPGLVFADPDFGDRGTPGAEGDIWPPAFEPLSFTAAEGRAISRQAKRDQARLLSGAEAEEIHLKAAVSPAFLHFATHGFFLGEVQLPSQRVANRDLTRRYLSGLALAGANRFAAGADLRHVPEDGILTAAEVESLQLLGTELVVMSACETGLGYVDEEVDKYRGPKVGEGAASLRRAFRTAGAENVVMSFWEVADQQAATMMAELYRHVFAGKPPVEALRAARETIRWQLVEEYRVDHPFFWAAFGIETATLSRENR